MNRRTSPLLILLIAVASGGALVFGLSQSHAASEACKGAQTTMYTITIGNDQPSSTTLSAHLCNTLTFTNTDNVVREIAFGPHDHHATYDGFTETFLKQNQSFTITLNAIGTFQWHDHLHESVKGTFSVIK